MTIANKKQNIRNGIEACLLDKIYAKKKELMKECENFIKNLKTKNPDLSEYIDSLHINFEVKAEERKEFVAS